MKRSICNQCKQLSGSWTVLLVFMFMCYMVLNNFIHNVNTYEGLDVIEMYHPMRILTLTQDSASGVIIMQMLPLLVVIACGFTYIKDRNAGIEIFEISRSGARNYFWSKIVASFLVTMCVFSVPLLVEILLNCLSFPMEATGDMSNFTNYDDYLIKIIRGYFFYEVYQISPYLYAIVYCFIFGAWAGLAAAFVVAISFLPVVKARLVLFLPLYMIITGLVFLGNVLKTEKQSYYGFYLFMYEGFDLSRLGYVMVLLLLIVTIIGITWWKCKEDCRNR